VTLEADMLDMGQRARVAAATLRTASADQRSAAISAAAAAIRRCAPEILAANASDVAAASGMIDRLRLTDARVEAMARALEEMAALLDVVGLEMARWTRPNGLDIARVRTPIGVIGMIYESRPNVTADAAAICLRSANAVILRPGSDSLASCLAIHAALLDGLAEARLPADCVQIIPTPDRAAVGHLLSGLDGTIDLIIPRGGKALVARVSSEARVATLGHLEGICHSYVHASADLEMALKIVANAKLRRTEVCGSTETLLVDRAIAQALLPRLAEALPGCELRGDEESRALAPMETAKEADWSTEYLDAILSVRVVPGLDEAVAHIARFGTGHTEAIIAEDAVTAEKFLDRVDSAIVIWNASTQYADGGEFGFGGEIGIATGKMHARGPVGAEQLTSFKYVVRGSGQARP